MRRNFIWIIIGILFMTSPAFGQQVSWKLTSERNIQTNRPKTVNPNTYRLYNLDLNQIKQVLAQAGDSYEEGIQLSIPTPNQGFEDYIVWRTPIMEKALAEQYPDFQTYTATSVKNPFVSAKMDITSYGYRATVFNGAQVYFIAPYSYEDNNQNYFVYYAADDPEHNHDFSCNIGQHSNLLSPAHVPVNLGNNNLKTMSFQNGSVRHNYRLAMACTGEYALAATANDPTPQHILSAIISTVNNINGVYERELSVHFTLVAGEPSILFGDYNTDPYTCNNNMDCLLGENQIAVDNNIGDANYEVGHIFCTAGGGLAQLGAVCMTGAKAKGASTSSGPTDFHTPLHELGHMFGARHTFNAETGGCDGNIDTTSSYEPGSGSTIMSYGGSCDPNNVVGQPDDYFNIVSLLQMTTFIHSLELTPGFQCGTTSNGVNMITVPENNIVRKYNIPKNTPFELSAPAVLPTQQNASAAYNWEQHDLGNFGGTETDEGDETEGPIMRSYPPSETGNIRLFPTSAIINNSYSAVGERLPKEAREVSFKFTARSVIQGWGSFSTLDSVVTINVVDKGPFRVTNPDIDHILDPEGVLSLQWDPAQTDQAPINCQSVNIYLSLDNGQTFPIALAMGVPNNGHYDATMPNVYTTKGRIMVQGTSNVFYDVAHGKFTINGTQTGIENTYIKDHLSVYPNPAKDLVNIKFDGQSNVPLTVNMYDMTGRLVKRGSLNNQLTLRVGDLAKGLYQIQIINPETAANTTIPVSVQ